MAGMSDNSYRHAAAYRALRFHHSKLLADINCSPQLIELLSREVISEGIRNNLSRDGLSKHDRNTMLLNVVEDRVKVKPAIFQTFIEALQSDPNLKTLAAALLETQQRTILTKDDFRVVKKAVFKARRQWRRLGSELGISEDDLDNMEGDDNEDCLEKMLRVLLTSLSLRPTWEALVMALREQTVGREDIAEEIAKKYLTPAEKVGASTQPQHGPTPDQKSPLQACATLLKRRYRSKMPGCAVQFPTPPTNTYTDLSLIERRGGSAGREIVKLRVEGNVREVLKKSKEVELKNLFKLDHEHRKVILIEGPPGSGKTTLAWHVCQEWESGKLFSEFDLVVYVELRNPAIHATRSIADLFRCKNDKMARDVLTELEAKDGEGVLFVLDGWDELPRDLAQDSPLRKITEPDFDLLRSAVIVTSRPEASTEFRYLASSRVQLVGFTPEKVEEYFTESMKGDSQAAKELMERLKEYPAIESSCYIPLIATILAAVFAETHRLPSSLTGVFILLVTYCILRHCKRKGDKTDFFSSLDNLPQPFQTSFDSLCALAFQGILLDQITFAEEECKTYPEFATLNLLEAVTGFLDAGLTRTYNFLHLSIQELLAARHISKLRPSDTQIKNVHCLLDDERFAGVFRFYAGISHLPGIEGILRGILREMVQTYKDGGRTAKHWRWTSNSQERYQMELLLECLHEVQDSKLYQMVAEELGGERLFLTFPSPVACLSAGYLLPRLSCPHIELWNLNDQRILLFTKGFTNSCHDHQQPRSGINITLKCLDLRSHDGLLAIGQLLSSFHINHLVLEFVYRSFIDPQVVLTCISKAMITNTSVRSLELQLSQELSQVPSASPSGDSPGPEFCEMLKRNKTLKTLRFRDCPPIGPYVVSIAAGLKRNKTLKELVLDGCDITDTGAKTLADMLMDNTALETLQVSSRIDISAEGKGHLAEAKKKSSTLRFLTFGKCSTV